MRRFTSCVVLCGILVVPSMARAAIIINEFSYDDGGTDDREFVELHNNGAAAIDISGWTLGGRDPSGLNSVTTIPAATNIGPGGYYVIGNAAVLNVNFVAAGGFLENDNETIELRSGLFASAPLEDAVAYETNKGAGFASPTPGAAAIGPGIFGNMNPPDLGTNNVRLSVASFVDGRDTDNNGRDFAPMRPSTPGTSNTPSGFMYRYLPPDPAGSIVGSDVPGLTGNFVNARFIDPTVVSLDNPNAIPAPYSTGNRAIVAWDPSGGGNGITSNQTYQTTRGAFRILAYFDTSDQPQNTNAGGTAFTGSEISIYSIGGGDPITNLTDLSGAIGVSPGTLPASDTANGTTGVAWVYERTAISGGIGATQTLYLVDANDGGDSDLGGNTPLDWTIIQTIDISGLASDWYELSIKVDEFGGGTAHFNGTDYVFATSTALHSGAFNVAYRENLQVGADGTPDALMRPPTFTRVPEPGTFALLMIVLIGLAAARRR